MAALKTLTETHLRVYDVGFDRPPLYTHGSARRSMQPSKHSVSHRYEHIITSLCFANQDGNGRTPYPMRSVIIISYLRSGANINTVMGIAIGYLCITYGVVISGDPSLFPRNEAGRRPVMPMMSTILRVLGTAFQHRGIANTYKFEDHHFLHFAYLNLRCKKVLPLQRFSD